MTALAWIIAAAIATVAGCMAASSFVRELVDRAALAAALDLANTDTDWVDPWHATPTFRNLCANNPDAVAALAAAEASRADWAIPENWSNR